jgi:hypothetical protein
MRPFVVLMGLAALVVAACGSNPPASSSPSASIASGPPAVVASPSAATGTTFAVKLPAGSGKRVSVTVHDQNGVLSTARVPTSAESKAVSHAFHGGNAAITGGKSAKLLVVGWVGTACDKKVDVSVQGTKVTVAPTATAGTCITKAVPRSVTLKFITAVDPEAMTATFIAPAAQP